MALTKKQQVFIENYLTTWNATESARRANYAFPNVEGPKNLVNPSIKAQIEARLSEIKMSADEVLVRLARMARSNISEFAHVATDADLADLGNDGQVIRKFKRKKYYPKNSDPYDEIELELYPADVNLERVGKHLGLFKETHTNLNYDLSKATDEQLQRIAAGEDPAHVFATTQSVG